MVAAEIGATNPRGYNTILLAFWIPNQDGTSNPVDAAIVWTRPESYFDIGNSQFGTTGDQIRANLVNEYHKNGVKILVSAFGGTSFPTTQGVPAKACGENLAQFVIDMQLDGVDLDYEDNAAMEAGTAVPWLIEMTDAMVMKFKATGKKYIMTNAPQAPYFIDGRYPMNYVAFHKSVLSDGTEVGDYMDSYLVQFYNQGSSTYSSYISLFVTSDGWSVGTSVSEIAAKGIPLSKIAVGKPITQADAANTGFIPVATFASIIQTARKIGQVWVNAEDVGGVMGWRFQSDRSGSWISQLQTATAINSNTSVSPSEMPRVTSPGASSKPNTQTSSSVSPSVTPSIVPGVNQGTGLTQPVYAVYVNTLNQWWGDVVAAEIGATNPRGYNTILLAFWIPNQDGTSNPVDAAVVWAQPDRFFNVQNSQFGTVPEQIRTNLINEYHKNGVKILVSAFGGTSFPTTQGVPAKACGENLAQFVIDMQLDGVDLDYEDNAAMEAGTAVPWLIEMTDAMVMKFKATGKKYIMTNAPQAPYFIDGRYPMNYVAFHKSVLSDGTEVGDYMDSYLVQFYNQGSSTYSSYTSLFVTSDGWSVGTSVSEIAAKGIPLSKIAVGKPITQADAANTGFVPVTDLASIIDTARQPGEVWANGRDVGGVMGWRFQSDRDGTWISQLQVATDVEPIIINFQGTGSPDIGVISDFEVGSFASSIYSPKEIIALCCISLGLIHGLSAMLVAA